MQDLFAALALLLVIEGILPFANPSSYRSAMKTLLDQDDGTLRKIGIGSMVAGLVLLYFVK